MYKLKIAQIAPIWYRIPPKEYGGTERVVSALTEELVKRGHDVILFASGDSITSAKLSSVVPNSLIDMGIKSYQKGNELILRHIGNAYNMQADFDIIHDHLSFLNLPAANFSKTPVVLTLHGPVTPEGRKLYEIYKNINYVSISKSQIKYFPDVNLAGTVYNGLDMESYPFGGKDKGYLLFVGRIAKVKGVHFAVKIAKELNLPLIIAAKLDNRDKPYFKKYIKPYLNNKIKWIGEVDQKERNDLFKNALCLINPIIWKEPFGLTMIEAMACGCPVVAFNNGSIPEVIKNGKTGFAVDDLGEMVEAVKKIDSIERSKCRNYSLENFNSKTMADKYEEIYYKIVEEKLNFKDFMHSFFQPHVN